ncbi:lasso peptide biosynthesis B2 protein [Streptomyces yaizuensis]|uniref:Lasso peptide biosynthesis B2 protein n=1 Tax=Streptomyces yaizuensis TaxID=2989713 RepID=A0ABQ5PA37_9ACTN|nr:lasso peptide biosynthesis B2 protein [Streptomyces sp. YSPA8]GLF99451.1 lasso peptide biosynthesis B2 protein [Streptomyces sp. YSPA8]
MTSVESYATVRAGTARERALARLGLAVAVLLLRLPFRWAVRVAQLARIAGRRPLSADRALEVVEAVRYAGRRWPVRVACLESSLGAMLACALLGRRLTWCVGTRVEPPTEYHAWARIPGGQPVGECTEDGWHYMPALEI